MNIIMLEVGDKTGLGHERSEVITLDVTGATRSSLDSYHKEGCKILGRSLEGECDEDGGNTLSNALKDELNMHGMWCPDVDGYDSLAPGDFAELYMEIAKLAAPHLEWEHVSFERLHIGGYGLFL